MKKKLAVLVLGAFLITGLVGCGNKVPAGTVATVNGEPISQEELDVNYTPYLQMLQMYGADITSDEVKIAARNAALQDLTMQKLLLQEAEKRGLKVTDAEVDTYIQQLVDNYFSGDLSELEKTIEDNHVTLEQYKKLMKDDLLIEKLRQDIQNNPEKADVIKARHILIDAAAENAEQKAQDIITQLDNGADFAELAKEYSQVAPGSAADGGELGYFAVPKGSIPAMMVNAFTDGAKELEIGEYSKTPVQTQFGYHIILVEDKQTGVNLLEKPDEYAAILSSIYQRGLNALAETLYTEAEENGKIEILIDEDAVPEDKSTDEAAGDAQANGDDAAEGEADAE